MKKRVYDLESFINWFYNLLLSIEHNGIELDDWTMFGVSGFDFTSIKLEAEKHMEQLGIEYDSERAENFEQTYEPVKKRKTKNTKREINYEDVVPYLGRRLWSADKRKLIDTLDIYNKNGRQLRWPTIRNILVDEGYSVIEKKSGGLRYAVIEKP